MNGPKENLSADWRAKYPDPPALAGRWVRHVRTREFAYISDANEKKVELMDGPNRGKPRTLTLEQLAKHFNLVPEGRI